MWHDIDQLKNIILERERAFCQHVIDRVTEIMESVRPEGQSLEQFIKIDICSSRPENVMKEQLVDSQANLSLQPIADLLNKDKNF